MTERSKYHKRIRGEWIDVYDILEAFECGCSASEHAVKKLLMGGKRGSKDRLQDLIEAGASINRAIQIEKERQQTDDKRGPDVYQNPPVLIKSEI